MAERLYEGLAIAEIKYDNRETNKRLNKSSKEDVEFSYAIRVDDMLPRDSAFSSYKNSYETEEETRLEAQAKNLANPVKFPVSSLVNGEDEMLSRLSDWAIVKRRHWRQGQYKSEDEHSSESTNSERTESQSAQGDWND